MEHIVNEVCTDRFKKIEGRLEKGDTEFRQLGTTIAVLDDRQKNTQKSLETVLKVLWSIAAAFGTAALTLIVYILTTKFK